MKNRINALIDQLGSSYWFIPSIMAFLAIVLSVVTIRLDEVIEIEAASMIGLMYVNSPEGARAVLSAIAGSMITVAGVVFSITMVVLSLTSQQYGPLVLRNFMQDKGNQFVLGVFTSTFLYCLLILRTVRGFEDSIFVPNISILVGVGLAIISLAVLIYFIHHVSETIQPSNIVARISHSLNQAAREQFPSKIGHEESASPPRLPETQVVSVHAVTSGYIEAIDEERLIEIAVEHDLVIEVKHRPGHFIITGQPLVEVRSLRQTPINTLNDIQTAFMVGDYRTEVQDIEFLFMQLVSIAVRSLSPGINDPFTAILCIDRLGEGLCLLAGREAPAQYRYDDSQHLRVIASPFNFAHLLGFSFDQIRHYGQSDLKVMIRLMQVVADVAECSSHPEHDHLLKRYAELLYQQGTQNVSTHYDQAQLDHAFEHAKHRFNELSRSEF